MRVRWFGQSAFLLRGERLVFVDPFGDMSAAASHGFGLTTRRSRA
jgi:L-ascorbate metabolism protein UlaG (beta-lactamase superfamily)